MLKNKTILLGVTGGIAAYKAADLASRLGKEGCSVHAVLTRSAVQFIPPLTLQTITGNRAVTDMFADYVPEVEHISLAKQADLVLIAPATANFIAKAAAGIADDMLTTTLLAAWSKPTIVCPAMNTAMYENPITQRNIRTLRELGFRFVEPKESRLACGDVGRGALADLEVILSAVREELA